MSSRAHSTETTHSVHEVDKYGCTGLHYSAYNGEVPQVTTLIESGANVNARDNHGWTPLHYAALKGESNVGPEINEENKSEIHISARYIEIDKLVRESARLDEETTSVMVPFLCCLCPWWWWWGDESYMSQCYYDIITLLVNSGASVNIKNNEGLTALHLSASLGCRGIVRMLINHGCEIDTVDNKGHTPLHLAQRNGQKNVVDILISSGSSLNIKDIDGRTLLHWSSHHGWYEIVTMLVNSGCEIDPVDNTGRTPLQLAKKKKNVDIVNLLREAKPFQHGDSQLYRMKETVKMFFGFSRTVEREERGAVGGRNIQSGDINAEILDNTDNDELFEDATNSTIRVNGATAYTSPTSCGMQPSPSVPETPETSSSTPSSMKRSTVTKSRQTDTDLLTAVGATTTQATFHLQSQTTKRVILSHDEPAASRPPTTKAPTGSGSTATFMPASRDPAETIVSCVQQLIRDHPSTVGQTSYSSTRTVDNLNNRTAPVSVNVNVKLKITNMHKPQNCAVSGNVNLIKGNKKEKPQNDEDSDDESVGTQH